MESCLRVLVDYKLELVVKVCAHGVLGEHATEYPFLCLVR